MEGRRAARAAGDPRRGPTSAVIALATAAIGSTVAAKGLGEVIIAGLLSNNLAFVVQGEVVVALLAVALYEALSGVERIVPAGLAVSPGRVGVRFEPVASARSPRTTCGDRPAPFASDQPLRSLRQISQRIQGLQKLVPQERIRTPDPIITNDVLYQLSYCG